MNLNCVVWSRFEFSDRNYFKAFDGGKRGKKFIKLSGEWEYARNFIKFRFDFRWANELFKMYKPFNYFYSRSYCLLICQVHNLFLSCSSSTRKNRKNIHTIQCDSVFRKILAQIFLLFTKFSLRPNALFLSPCAHEIQHKRGETKNSNLCWCAIWSNKMLPCTLPLFIFPLSTKKHDFFFSLSIHISLSFSLCTHGLREEKIQGKGRYSCYYYEHDIDYSINNKTIHKHYPDPRRQRPCLYKDVNGSVSAITKTEFEKSTKNKWKIVRYNQENNHNRALRFISNSISRAWCCNNIILVWIWSKRFTHEHVSK